jgi:hypothetical protein
MADTEAQKKFEQFLLAVYGVSPRDFIFRVLRQLAQAEHELMVQYLYAAYSVGGEEPNGDPTFLRDCRDTLLAVAREEMGHLLTVQNMLLFNGGDVYLERWPSHPNASPIKFKLEQFSRCSLLRYLRVECPSDDAWREARLPELCDEEKDEQRAAPGLQRLFENLDIFFANVKVTVIPDSLFDPASYPYQATWDEFARGYGPHNAEPYALGSDDPREERGHLLVSTMTTRAQFLSALHDIVGQGEGRIHWPLSHFHRFTELFRRLQSIQNKDPSWSPSRPLAKNPWVGSPWVGKADPWAGDGTNISAEPACYWAQLFNLRYRMLLSLLTYLFRVPRDGSPSGGEARGQILSHLFGEMYNMKAIAGILVRLPSGKNGKVAGPTFELPETLAQPISKAAFWSMHLELLNEAVRRTELLDDTWGENGKSCPPEARRYPRFMLDADKQTRRWVQKILAGEVSLP